ncbi:MAG: T9SS type A sorting domain-containing protein [Aureispira sp.]|nr:T9SS type A sorting domain-containing protein [Aureispira sp.]
MQKFIFTALLTLFFFGEYATAQTVQVGIHRYGGCTSDTLRAYGWTPGGPAGPYTYNWSNGDNTELTYVTTIGTYTCTMTNTSNGATGTASYYFNGTAPLSGSFIVTPASCGQNNGAVDLTLTGGDGINTVYWSHGPTTEDLSNLATGVYTVSAYDSSGCYWADTVSVGTSGGALALIDSTYLCDTTNSWITTYAPNGQWPFSYQWSDGSTNDFINNPSPGTYGCTLTDANGCIGTTSIVVPTLSSPINASYTVTDASCGLNNGAIDLTVSGGSGAYTYYWYNPISGTTTQDPSGLAAGTYAVWIGDGTGCGKYVSGIVVNGGNASISTSTTATTCGANNGSATATVTGMTNPTISWSGIGVAGATVSNLSSGYYAVIASDSTCTVIDSFYIGASTALTLIDSIDLCDTTNSWITTYAPNGQWPFMYQWSDGSSTSFINNPTLGATYSVTLTDANGCTGTSTFNIPNSISPINASYTVTDASCGLNNGAIDLTVSGGSGTYTYYWYNPISGTTTQDPSGLAAGTYAVWIGDGTGCGKYVSGIVVSGGNASLSATGTNTSCGLSNGSATATVSGMTNPSIHWSTGDTGVTSISGLTAGTYIVYANDGSCFLTDTVTISNSGNIFVGISPDSSSCPVTELYGYGWGGTAPYTYNWSNGASSSVVSGLTPGTYTLSVTDAGGCTDTANYTIQNISPISLSSIVTDANCGNTGAIDLTATGGSGSFSYWWSNGGSTEDLNNLNPGVYNVWVWDNINGCSASLVDTVGGQSAQIWDYISPASCSLATGQIYIYPDSSSWTSPSYVWSTGDTTDYLTNLASGWYGLTVTDALSGCVYTDNYYVPNDTTCMFTIAGRVRDISASGICQYSGSSAAAYEMVRLQPLGLITFTNASGYYSFNVTTPGNYTVEFVNSGASTIQCPSTNSIAVNNTTYGNFYGNNNFYITNPPVQDLRVNLYHWSTVTPGFAYYTALKYYNDGNNTMNGTITYQYDSQITYDYFTNLSSSYWTGSATLVNHDALNRTLTFSVSNLAAGEQGKIYVYFDAPTTAVLGNVVTNVASITPIVGDVTPSNNTDMDSTIIVGSWDPNDKQVSPYHTGTGHTGGIIYLSEEELEYTIRFQNTGTAPAHRVVIRDILDMNLDINTIRDMSASHDVSNMYIDNGTLVVEFNNINLPDSGANFAGSNGYVQFTINRLAGLSAGTQIHNSADIYFDFNAPITTNTVISTIDNITATEKLEEADNQFEVQTMPNPFNEQLTVQYTLGEDTNLTIELYNAVGERVRAYEMGANKAAGMHVQQLPTDYLPAGMYLLRVETDQQIITKKVIKN